MSNNINVTPFSIGGASGDALYVYVDGRNVLSGMEKIEIERRVNNYDRMADEVAELCEFLASAKFTMEKAKNHHPLPEGHDCEMLRQQIEVANGILAKHK